MLIVSKNDNEVLKSIKYLFDQERMEYEVSSVFKNTADKVIFIIDNVDDVNYNIKSDILLVTNKKISLDNFSCKSNEIITKLVSDNKKYTKAQEEYLFRDGIYRIINNIVLDFISDKTINKLIYDTSCCKLEPTDWIFKFDSIAESYEWLSGKNKNIGEERKVIEISNNDYNFMTFNDSDKEINYLSEYIFLAKNGTKVSTIFVGDKEYIESKKKNRYFDILVRKCGENVKTYFCDIDVLSREEPILLEKIRDGVAIYGDCVYRDTFDDEFSLGVVDCKLESVKEYTEIFDYILDKYCVLLVEGGEYVGI